MAAASYEGKVLLFGGIDYASFNMYSFREEGELLADFSSDGLIPGGMTQAPFVVQDRKVYATGWREIKKALKWRLEAFDGKKWTLL